MAREGWDGEWLEILEWHEIPRGGISWRGLRGEKGDRAFWQFEVKISIISAIFLDFAGHRKAKS